MRLVRYEWNSEVRVGVLDRDEAVDIAAALASIDSRGAEIAGDMGRLIAAGEEGRTLVRRALASKLGRVPAQGLRLRAPLRPEIILCSGENYWDHRDEKPPVEGKEPEFFIKVPHGVIGPEDEIVLDPKVTRKLDYETELAVVIGKSGRHIAPERALLHVFGYTIMNDCTARDRQVRMRPDGTCWYAVGPGKNFDTCAPMGPLLVTADEIDDPQALELSTLVNGELRQSNSTAKMIWGVAELVSFFSTYLTLRPGFVISTGTPGGTAWAADPELGGRPYERGDVVRARGYLAPGDVVTCRIEGIGELRNRVVDGIWPGA